MIDYMNTVTGIVVLVNLLIIGVLVFKYIRSKKSIEKLSRELENNERGIRKFDLEFIKSEEKHHQYIATEFHDRVAQNLALAKNKSDYLKKQVDNEEYKNITEEISQLIGTCIQETRLFIRELSPPLLRDSSIVSAIEWLLNQLKDNSDMFLDYENRLELEQPLSMEMKIFLFQSIREILHNILKHAQAQNVHTILWEENGFLWIKITDDGIGVPGSDHDKNNVEYGFGLSNIHYRLSQIEGKLHIDSEEGKGTTVRLGIPL